MVGKTNVAGARLRSVISVTYPEGSVCTCSNGTKTLKARDTSGKALFNVSTGTWTITATDGDKTKSISVSITTDGQSKSVTLSYELVLYRAGDANIAVTGGWNAYDKGINSSYPNGSLSIISLNKGTDKMTAVVTNMGQYGCIIRHGNAVDLTPYKSIKFRGSVTASDAVASYVNFVCWSPSIGTYWADNMASVKNLGGASWSEFSLDISEINDVGIVGFSFFNADATVNITEIYLE